MPFGLAMIESAHFGGVLFYIVLIRFSFQPVFEPNRQELAEHLGHIQSSEPHGGKLPHQA